MNKGADLSDWLAAGGTRVELDTIATGAPRWVSTKKEEQQDASTRRAVTETRREGTLVELTDPEPWSEAVVPADLLDTFAAKVNRYCVLPREAADTIALWSLFTWAHDRAEVSPILVISGPTKRCGKSRVLSVLGAIVRRAASASHISPAALFRLVERWEPTLLLDEADTFVKLNEELRGLLNSGHTRHAARVYRVVGDRKKEVVGFSTWAPKAAALIGALPDTVQDRAIVILMQRKLPSDKVAELRQAKLVTECEELRRMAARWAADNSEVFLGADPVLPDGLDDRQRDNWRHLLAIGDHAGGDWPARARRAANALSAVEGEEALATQVLEAIRDILEERRASTGSLPDRITTQELLDGLNALTERPWADWHRGQGMTGRALARILKPFGIKPHKFRTSGLLASWRRGSNTTPRGYEVADLEGAIARYVRPRTGTSATSQPGNDFQA
jgi:putative DNA primase/helicase